MVPSRSISGSLSPSPMLIADLTPQLCQVSSIRRTADPRADLERSSPRNIVSHQNYASLFTYENASPILLAFLSALHRLRNCPCLLPPRGPKATLSRYRHRHLTVLDSSTALSHRHRQRNLSPDWFNLPHLVSTNQLLNFHPNSNAYPHTVTIGILLPRRRRHRHRPGRLLRLHRGQRPRPPGSLSRRRTQSGGVVFDFQHQRRRHPAE